MATSAAPAPPAPTPPQPGGSGAAPASASGPAPGASRPGPDAGGAEFDALSDVADLFEGADPDAAGRLAEEALAGTEGAPQAGEEAPPEGEEAAEGEGGPLQLGGITFPNQAALEHYIATNQGRLSSLQQQVSAGREWQQYAQELEAQLEGSGQEPEGEAPAAMGETGMAPAPPADFNQAFLQAFPTEWYQPLEAAFVQAVSAQDESGVRAGFRQVMTGLLENMARFQASREAQQAQRWQAIDQQQAEARQIESATNELKALTNKALLAQDEGGGYLFPDLATVGPDGRTRATELGKQALPIIGRLMVEFGYPRNLRGFGLAYVTAMGILNRSASATAPSAAPRPAGDPTLSGTGVAPVGAPRRPAAPPDPTGLPSGPVAGRMMGIRRGVPLRG